MTASSGVVLSNLAYLIGAVVLAVIGGLLVWLRHRRPQSVDANVESFHRGLRALAPDVDVRGTPESRARIEPQPGGSDLGHGTVPPGPGPGRRAERRTGGGRRRGSAPGSTGPDLRDPVPDPAGTEPTAPDPARSDPGPGGGRTDGGPAVRARRSGRVPPAEGATERAEADTG